MKQDNEHPLSKHTAREAARKRVIIFASQLLPISETFIREQARSLKDWDPILVGERLVPDGLPLDDLKTCLLTPRNESKLRRWSYVLCRILGIAHLPSVWRLRKLNASLIHVHFGTNAVDIWPIARALSLPMLVTLHGFDISIRREWWESGQGGWQKKSYPERLSKLAKNPMVRFIAVSEPIKTRAIALGISSEKIHVHYIGIDTVKFSPRPDQKSFEIKKILFVGRLVEKKGAEYLLKAYSVLARQYPNIKLIIVGDGPMRSQLENISRTLGISVDFTGAITNERIIRHMHDAYVLCAPSITASNGDAEGMPTVLLEAQACGVPVVTSALGIENEGLLEGSTGFRVNEKDVGAIIDSLKIILSDEKTQRQLSKNSSEYVRSHFSIQNCSQTLEKIYDSLK